MKHLRDLNKVRAYAQSGLVRARRAPNPDRVLYMDMDTLRDGQIRNWDDDSGATDTVAGNAAPSPSGMPAGSYYFDGSTYMAIGTFPLAGTALTLAMWVRCKAPQGMAQTFMGDDYQSTTVGYIWLYCQQNTTDLKWQYADGSAVGIATAPDFFLGYSEAWVHMAVVCDYDAKICKFYRNGVLHTTVAMDGVPVFPSASRARGLGATDPTPAFNLTDGNIDELQMFESAPSAVQILDEYSKPAAR